MTLAELITKYGEAGLVFVLMTIAISFLAKAFLRIQKKFEKITDEFNTYLKEAQNTQVETIIRIFNLLKSLKDDFDKMNK